ncbi:MAG: hypothetical protein AAGF44_10845 [Pseudomonadota bacterium]
MASKSDHKRLRQLAVLAELAAQRTAADLHTKKAVETQLDERLIAIDHPSQTSEDSRVRFTASGAAQLWHIWQVKERRRLGILAARARLAADAARRAHARAEARRRVLEKICKPK